MKQQSVNYKRSWRETRAGSFIFNLKRNRLWLRRFASLWLFLIVLEIACPILECENLEDFNSNATVNSQVYHQTDNYEKLAPSTLIAKSGDTGQQAEMDNHDDSSETHCSDECLCHVTGIPSLAFDLPKIHIKPDLLAVKPIDAPTLALPPPFQPPKTA